MNWLEAIVLALIQGLTEFLPISSSAHLILPKEVLGWAEQGLAYDVALHIGTLMAVMGYFRKEIYQMFVSWCRSFTGYSDEYSRLAWLVILGTIPTGLIGFIAHDWISENLRSASVIAVTTLIFGLLLGLADIKGKRERTTQQMKWQDALWIGLAQVLALIPGTSRSGVTITAALALGLDRQAAARFSFLLSIPTILAAGGLESVKLAKSTDPVNWTIMGTGVLVAFLSAYACIHLFLKWIERIGMMPFVIYRLLLAAALFLMIALT